MLISFAFGANHLKVTASVLADLAAGFILLALGSKNPFILTGDVLFAILCFIGAVRLEDLLSFYD